MPPPTPLRLRASSLAGLKKDGELTINLAGATALYVVPKSGGASGRRLLDNDPKAAIVYVDEKPVEVKVRAHAHTRKRRTFLRSGVCVRARTSPLT
jgi:hypothetical protein